MTLLAQARRPMFEPSWVGSHLDDIASAALEHLVLTAIAVGTGFALAAALTAVSLRWRRLYPVVIAVTGSLYTIPSLALFALLVPVTGLGVVTAEIALVSYTLLILVRNMVTGLENVPADVVDAAAAMGYSRLRRLVEIEVPLALPAIVAGLRLATVTVVGLVTVTALIGMGGFGAMILSAIRRSILFPTPAVVGTAGSIALAAVLDVALAAVLASATRWRR